MAEWPRCVCGHLAQDHNRNSGTARTQFGCDICRGARYCHAYRFPPDFPQDKRDELERQRTAVLAEFNAHRYWNDLQCKQFRACMSVVLRVQDESFRRLHGDGGLEDIIHGLVECLQQELGHQQHEGVRGCLIGAIENLRDAAFAYYASFK